MQCKTHQKYYANNTLHLARYHKDIVEKYRNPNTKLIEQAGWKKIYEEVFEE